MTDLLLLLSHPGNKKPKQGWLAIKITDPVQPQGTDESLNPEPIVAPLDLHLRLAVSEPHADPISDSNAHAISNPNSKPYPYTHTDSEPHTDSNTASHANSHSHSAFYADSYPYGDTNSYAPSPSSHPDTDPETCKANALAEPKCDSGHSRCPHP